MHERAGEAVPEGLASEPPEIPLGWEPVYRDFAILSRQRRWSESALAITEDEMERQAERSEYAADDFPDVLEVRAAWVALDDELLEFVRKKREELFRK